jgi:hypothetical protein
MGRLDALKTGLRTQPEGLRFKSSTKTVAPASEPVVKLQQSPAGADGVPKSGSFWTKKTANGRRVYQRDNLIDAELVDARGRTNLQRMEKGLAPLGPDGKPMELHHMLQGADDALAEMTHSFHKSNSKTIHINSSSTPSGIDRNMFNNIRKKYWKTRAGDFRKAKL